MQQPLTCTRSPLGPTLALHLTAAALLTTLAGWAATPAQAGTFTPPQGCTLEVTIQNRSCTVSQHYRCTADQPGDQRVTYFQSDGPSYKSRIDKETRWVESHDLRNGIIDVLGEDARDPASFSDLLASGRDDFDFTTASSTGEILRHIGHDELTGKKVTIDGVALEETAFDLKTYNQAGDLLIQRRGNQFISRAQGRFYGGIEHSEDWTGQVIDSNDSPVRFAFPGQPGFGETTPSYDCDLQMVEALPHPAAPLGAPS